MCVFHCNFGFLESKKDRKESELLTCHVEAISLCKN